MRTRARKQGKRGNIAKKKDREKTSECGLCQYYDFDGEVVADGGSVLAGGKFECFRYISSAFELEGNVGGKAAMPAPVLPLEKVAGDGLLFASRASAALAEASRA